MASDYRELYTSYWPWALRRGLDVNAKCLGVYLLTCEHRTFEGIYRLPPAYAVADLGWDRETYDQALAALVDAGFVMVDDSVDVVFIVNALEYYQPKGGPRIAGAIKVLKRLPNTRLLRNLYESALTHSREYADAIEEGFPDVLDTPSIPPIEPPNTPSGGSSRAQTTPDQTQTRPETDQRASAPGPAPVALDDARQRLQREQVRQVFDAWVAATERDPQRTKLTDDRRRRIERALKSHGLDDCLAAVRNIGADKHGDRCARNGYGRTGFRYDDIEHALSGSERIERWRDATPGQTTAPVPRLANTGDFSRFEGL